MLKSSCPQIMTLSDMRHITGQGVIKGSGLVFKPLASMAMRFGSAASSAGATAAAAEEEANMEALAEALKQKEEAEEEQERAQQVRVSSMNLHLLSSIFQFQSIYTLIFMAPGRLLCCCDSLQPKTGKRPSRS